MATSPQQAPFDIRSLSACPIRLGRSAQQAPAPSRYTGIQYNHKPTTSNPKQSSTSINPPESGSKKYSLRLKEGQDEYLYKGSQGTTEHTYILVPDQEGDGYVLERLDASYKFNLSKAPWEPNAQVLGQRYPQLETADHDDDDEEGELFGDGVAPGDEGDADDDNPFDFRHYMHTAESPSPPSQPTKSSAVGTPSSVISQTSTRMNTPLAKSTTTRKAPSAFALQERRIAAKAKTKAKTEDRQQAQPKRARLSPEAEQQRREDIPTVRLDRRASTRVAAPVKKTESRPQQQQQNHQHSRNETDELSLDFDDHDRDDHVDDDDEGDLILEGDAPQASSSYRNQRSLGAALSGTLGVGNGPRSLQSAASSPVSMVNSPRSLQQHGNGRGTSPYDRHVDTDGEEIEIDMGQGSPDDLELDDGGYVDEDADAEGDVDDGGELVVDDADDDEDVDEMHLPSPAQVHRPSVSNTVVTADEDDDLENQMLLALEGGGDDDMLGGLQESEEESEEE